MAGNVGGERGGRLPVREVGSGAHEAQGGGAHSVHKQVRKNLILCS